MSTAASHIPEPDSQQGTDIYQSIKNVIKRTLLDNNFFINEPMSYCVHDLARRATRDLTRYSDDAPALHLINAQLVSPPQPEAGQNDCTVLLTATAWDHLKLPNRRWQGTLSSDPKSLPSRADLAEELTGRLKTNFEKYRVGELFQQRPNGPRSNTPIDTEWIKVASQALSQALEFAVEYSGVTGDPPVQVDMSLHVDPDLHEVAVKLNTAVWSGKELVDDTYWVSIKDEGEQGWLGEVLTVAKGEIKTVMQCLSQLEVPLARADDAALVSEELATAWMSKAQEDQLIASLVSDLRLDNEGTGTNFTCSWGRTSYRSVPLPGSPLPYSGLNFHLVGRSIDRDGRTITKSSRPRFLLSEIQFKEGAVVNAPIPVWDPVFLWLSDIPPAEKNA